jgi:hypothetical protein
MVLQTSPYLGYGALSKLKIISKARWVATPEILQIRGRQGLQRGVIARHVADPVTSDDCIQLTNFRPADDAAGKCRSNDAFVDEGFTREVIAGESLGQTRTFRCRR